MSLQETTESSKNPKLYHNDCEQLQVTMDYLKMIFTEEVDLFIEQLN